MAEPLSVKARHRAMDLDLDHDAIERLLALSSGEKLTVRFAVATEEMVRALQSGEIEENWARDAFDLIVAAYVEGKPIAAERAR